MRDSGISSVFQIRRGLRGNNWEVGRSLDGEGVRNQQILEKNRTRQEKNWNSLRKEYGTRVEALIAGGNVLKINILA